MFVLRDLYKCAVCPFFCGSESVEEDPSGEKNTEDVKSSTKKNFIKILKDYLRKQNKKRFYLTNLCMYN